MLCIIYISITNRGCLPGGLSVSFGRFFCPCGRCLCFVRVFVRLCRFCRSCPACVAGFGGRGSVPGRVRGGGITLLCRFQKGTLNLIFPKCFSCNKKPPTPKGVGVFFSGTCRKCLNRGLCGRCSPLHKNIIQQNRRKVNALRLYFFL